MQVSVKKAIYIDLLFKKKLKKYSAWQNKIFIICRFDGHNS